MNLIAIGINHQTASVALREKFAVGTAEVTGITNELLTGGSLAGLVILSTCNRVEFYGAGPDAGKALDALQDLLIRRAPGAVEADHDRLFYKHHGADAIRHLFRVGSGMESMVLGETEILGQLKKAYSAAIEAGSTPKHLNKLFQTAFRVAKEVRTKTNITRGSVSVGSTAVDLAEKIFGRLSECKVMVLGAGETAEMTSKTMLSRGLKQIVVANRSLDRGEELAKAVGGEHVPFDRWTEYLAEMDIVIGSTSSPVPVVTHETVHPVMMRRQDRPLFMIDLAVPRDIHPEVNSIEGVYLYDMDSLQVIARQSVEIRKKEMALCEQMIERHVQEFIAWIESERERTHTGRPESLNGKNPGSPTDSSQSPVDANSMKDHSS